MITEIRERDDAVKEGNDGDAEKIDTRQADVMILVGDEGEFGAAAGFVCCSAEAAFCVLNVGSGRRAFSEIKQRYVI